jgi:putative nucleotidyltransferase with HDIG domain
MASITVSLESRQLSDQFVQGLTHILDAWDHTSLEHSRRVARYAVQLARKCGWKEAELLDLEWGALLHDIGKVCIPAPVLVREGPLSNEDWAIVKHHPIFGFDVLHPIAPLGMAAQIVLCHHENWDGSGYPRGLQSETIPPGARIVALVEVLDALTSRPEDRAEWPKERVMSYIRDHSGSKFDPQVVAAFFR